MKRLSVIILGAALLWSCENLNPEEYRNEIEDCLRYEISIRTHIEQATEINWFSQALDLRKKPSFNASDYTQIRIFLRLIKEIRHYSTYYEALLMLRLNIDDYEPHEQKANEYRNIISGLIVTYNKTELALSPFKKVSSNEYFIEDRFSGSTCTIEKNGENVSINVTIKENH